MLYAETRQHTADGQSVQHRRIALRRTRVGVLPRNVQGRLFDDGFGREGDALAASAACLLVERPVLERLGGFSDRYRYGLEDVDLALRAREQGLGVIATGRAILYHRESATRHVEGRDFARATRDANRRALRETWGPQLARLYRQGILTGDQSLIATATPRATIVLTSLDPDAGWGDWHTGHELGEALRRRGWHVDFAAVGRDGTARLPGGIDFVISLIDRFDLRTVPHEVGIVAWVRNWAERWTERQWFDRIDVLLASSQTAVELIEERTGRRAELFPLATNPARFARGKADPRHAVDFVFTGNRWGKRRAIERALTPGRGQTLAVVGRGWESIKGVARQARGPVRYDELPAVYASAKVVLDDTQAPTLRYDAVNARVFDALAAGSIVITNCEKGVRELFDAEFPTWSTPEELTEIRVALLRDDARRRELVQRYRSRVLACHTYDHRAERLTELLRDRTARASVCIKIGAPDWDRAQRWGDLHFARALERELARRGHRSLIQVLEEWENDEGLAYDVVLHLKGLSRHHPKPGQFNVLWCISHPAELSGVECDGFDLVAIASESFAARMRTQTATPVIALEQATDPRVFYPDPHPDPDHHHDVVYVANSRNILRPMMRDLLPTELDLAVYGAAWDGLIDMRHVVAEHVPNDELRRVYSSARVVLADHWDDMRDHGFVSNRIYDAVACGARVVSDDVAGLEERFGDAVFVYRSAEELEPVIERAMAAGRPEPRTVASFADRLEVLLEHIPREARGVLSRR